MLPSETTAPVFQTRYPSIKGKHMETITGSFPKPMTPLLYTGDVIHRQLTSDVPVTSQCRQLSP